MMPRAPREHATGDCGPDCLACLWEIDQQREVEERLLLLDKHEECRSSEVMR